MGSPSDERSALNGDALPSARLELVERRPTILPPIRTGDRVRLRSGGPVMLAVDRSGEAVTVAWRDEGGAHEADLPLATLRLV